jgi:hypothetical protein
MKTKILSIVGLFVLLALGTILVATEAKAAATPVSFENAVQGYITPMSGTCTRFCTRCTPIGHGGACTTSGACC